MAYNLYILLKAKYLLATIIVIYTDCIVYLVEDIIGLLYHGQVSMSCTIELNEYNWGSLKYNSGSWVQLSTRSCQWA